MMISIPRMPVLELDFMGKGEKTLSSSCNVPRNSHLFVSNTSM